MRRVLSVAAGVVVAAGCGDQRPVGAPATAATSVRTAPSVAASLVRLARGGGTGRAYDGATLEQLPWQTADKVPAIGLVAGADLDQRNVYIVDTKRSLVSVELGSRRLRVIAPNVVEAAVGPDGSIYAVDTTRSVQVVARRGVTRFHTKLPRASRSLAGSPTGSLVAVLAGEPELVTLTEAGPLTTTRIAAGATASTMYGDVVAVAADSGVYVYESAGHRTPLFWPLKGHVRAIVFSPSGHRLYAGRESGGIAVIDRFSGNTIEEIALPGSVAELRVGQVGRWLLVRPVGRDSTWVVDLGTSKMIGAVATSWDADLPAVTAPSTVTVRHAGDVVAVKVTADRITETGRVRGGADDIWLPIAWAPESQPTVTADSIVATRDTTRKSKARDSTKASAAIATATATASSAESVPPAGQAIYLQVSSSRNPDWATSLVERLKDAHLPARTLAPATPDDPYRVVLGPYASRDEADAASRTIGMPSFVLTGPADPPARSTKHP